MTDLADRLASLEATLEGQEHQAKKKLTVTIVVYAILVLLVGAYTTVVGRSVAELTSTEALAEQIKGAVAQHLPAQRQALLAQIQGNSNAYAKSLVSYTIETCIPAVEAKTTLALASLTDMLAEAVHTRLMPAFVEFLRGDAPEIKRQYAALTDKEVGKGVALIFVSVIEAELDKYLNEQFVGDVGELQKGVRALGASGAKLTLREDAQRRALVYWAYLVEYAPVGDSVYYDLIQQAKARFQWSFGPPDTDE